MGYEDKTKEELLADFLELRRRFSELEARALHAKETEKKLKESEERYRAVFDNAAIGIDLLDRDGKYMQVNNALMSMLGYTDREFQQLRFTDITHPDDKEISQQMLEKVMRGEISTYRIEKRYIKKDGSIMWGDLSVSAIRNGNGEHIATLGVIADITDRKDVEKKLTEEKAVSDTIIDRLPGTFFLFDDKLKRLRWNKNLEKVTGYSADEISTMLPFDFFAEEAKAGIRAAIEMVLTDGAFAHEADVVAKDGTEIPYWFTGKLVRFGEERCVLGLGMDLTERRLAENRLKASLREKEILLREIYHRVKNNLQLISSLLQLQLGQIKSPDEGMVGAFEDIQCRIMAMAQVHDALYQSENLDLVDVSLYIQKIVDSLGASSPRSKQNLHIKTDVKSITFSIDVALACGLIVNELVTNSLKHAFPEGRDGEIVVTLVPTSEEEFQLTVRDNGIGMPQDIDLERSESLGLDLVAVLARQLHGTVEFATGEGTEFVVSFGGT